MSFNSIIIAGNGPSKTRINYKRVPKNAKICRVNNFYFEDKYYLGRVVDYYLVGIALLPQQFYNMRYLIENNEYDIKDMYVNNHWKNLKKEKKMNAFFPTVKEINPLINDLTEIIKFFKYYEYYYSKIPTVGSLAIAMAIGLGYKEIYITGIDFYAHDEKYAFDNGINFLNIRNEQDLNYKGLNPQQHSVMMEKEFIKMIMKNYDIKLYSICEDTEMNTLIEMAPELYENEISQEKEKDYLNDWLILPETCKYLPKKNVKKIGLHGKIKEFFIKEGLEREWIILRENTLLKISIRFMRFIYCILKVPILLIKVLFKILIKILKK